MWDADKCDLCGECLTRCHYVDYDQETAVGQIQALMEGKPADILKACVTCCACNEYCPTGANPFDLINHLQEVHGSMPIPETVTARLCGPSRLPSHTGQGRVVMYSWMRARC